MAERTAMPVADGTETPSAELGYLVNSADLAIGPNVSVVIPAKNEARNLPHVHASTPSWGDELVPADGDSVAGTVAAAIPLRPDVNVVTQNGHRTVNVRCDSSRLSIQIMR